MLYNARQVYGTSAINIHFRSSHYRRVWLWNIKKQHAFHLITVYDRWGLGRENFKFKKPFPYFLKMKLERGRK